MSIAFNISENRRIFLANKGAGGGGGITSLPIGNFVFVNPLGDDGTGVREDFSKPFATLNGAKNSALAGDTIYVYGGTYNEANTLFKSGVKWHFVGKPVVNLSSGIVFNDGGVQETISIKGAAIFNILSIGSLIQDTGINTVIDFNAYDVQGLGGRILFFQDSIGEVNVQKNILATLQNRAVQLGGNARITFNVDNIESRAIIGGVSNAINLQNQIPVYSGFSVFNGRIIDCSSNSGSTVNFEYGALTGTCIFNLSEKIKYSKVGGQANRDNALSMLSGKAIVNCDIDGGNGVAIGMQTKFFPKELEHNGKAYNDGNKPVVNFGALTPSFWSCGVADVSLNGTYTGANKDTIVVMGEGNNKISVNGRIENNNLAVNRSNGILILDDSTVIIESLVTYMIGSDPMCIGALSPKEIKIFRNLGSNADTDNITNLIAGTGLTLDSDFE
jgi:hypothetical protein